MPTPPPILDARTVYQILRQILDGAERAFDTAPSSIPRWRPRAELRDLVAAGQLTDDTLTDQAVSLRLASPLGDVGWMIALFYARLTELALERLNGVPEKNLLAFLDTMGIGLLPPSPARVPLTFAPTAGRPPTLVPSGTQAGTLSGGQGDPLLFETEYDLTVVPASINRAVTMHPYWDRYTDQTALLSGQNPLGFTPFVGATRMPHLLYIGDNVLLSFSRAINVQINARAGDPNVDTNRFLQSLSWQYRSQGQLKSPALPDPGYLFKVPESLDREILQGVGLDQGRETYWLRATLTTPFPDAGQAQNLILSGLTLKVNATGIAPDLAFADSGPIDLGRDFPPFGQTPQTGNAFYIASEEAFAKPRATVVLHLDPATAANAAAKGSADLSLVWEGLGDGGWMPMPATDTTAQLTVAGTVTLVLPAGMSRREVNGQTGFWIRARVAAGDYGHPLQYRPTFDSKTGAPVLNNGAPVMEVVQATLAPPRLKPFTIDYTAERAPQIVTQNGFLYAEQTVAVTGSPGFSPFVSVQDLKPPPYSDFDPALYLGFDAAFPEEAVTLYVAVLPRAVTGGVVRGAHAAPVPASMLAPVQWDYYNGFQWTKLTVFDTTAGLTELGTVAFLTPTDLAPLAKFDLVPRYWIRARTSAGDPVDTQQVLGVYVNTVSSVQGVTVAGAILGSGNGMPAQSLAFGGVPVLSDPRVIVREPEFPSDREAADIEAEEGADALQRLPDPVTGEAEIWVRWHEVANFVQSEPRSRHYTLDHTNGVITFGDGRRGLIPPRDTNNIRATYRFGGGAAGNVPAGQVAQISSSVPGIASVVNALDGDGGAPAETGGMVQIRGPRVLRHRGRAVAAVDLEWLAREAAGTRVARARCLPNINRDLRFEPGTATLIIVPRGAQSRLSPGPTLVREVEDYLNARGPAGLVRQTPPRLNILGPGYVTVAVSAEIAPLDIDRSEQIRDDVQSALAAFFHPLTGGPHGAGWDFGRNVYEAEVARVIGGVGGVDHVKSLALGPNQAQYRLAFAQGLAPTLDRDYPAASVVYMETGRKTALLAEPAPAGGASHLALRSFKEGDPVTVAIDLTVQTLSAGRGQKQITVNHAHGTTFPTVAFPRGSVVSSFDGLRRGRLVRGFAPTTDTADLYVDGATFGRGDLLTLFYPFPMTVRRVHVYTLDLTVRSAADANANTGTTTVVVAPFDTDAAGVPAGAHVRKIEGTVEGVRSTTVATGIGPGLSAQTEVTLVTSPLSESLVPGDVLRLHVFSQVLEIDPYVTETSFPVGALCTTLDNRVRLPLATAVPTDAVITSLRLEGFSENGHLSFRVDDPAPQAIQAEISPATDVVYLDDNFLVCSGRHNITMVSS